MLAGTTQKVLQSDVLIVGGGPAGLATAIQCASKLNTILIHKDNIIGKPVRTSGGSWISRLPDLKIPSRCFQHVDTLSFQSPSEEALFRFGNDHPIVFDTTALFQFLASCAEDAGATILCAHTFVGAAQDSDGSFTSTVKRDGTELQIRSRFLIDASGFSRAVSRQLLGIGIPQRAGVGCEVHIGNSLVHPNRAHLVMGTRYFPRGYGWLFPMPGRLCRLGIGIIDPYKSDSPKKYIEAFFNDTAGVKRLDPGLLKATITESEFHSGLIPADGPWKQVVFGRLVCVGDSCGQNLPTVGEGIRYCIEAGLKLGNSLAHATAANERRALRDYENWWIDQHLRAFEIGYQINKRITEFSDSQWDKVVRLLRLLNSDEVIQLLRLENVVGLAAKLLLRKPSIIFQLGKRAFKHAIHR